MKNSPIEWTDHTFNPWTGCTKVSPACANCYAELQAKRNTHTFGSWGVGAQRKRTSADYWEQPLRWNADAAKSRLHNGQPLIFTGSTMTAGQPETLRLRAVDASASSALAWPTGWTTRCLSNGSPTSSPSSTAPRISTGSCSPNGPRIGRGA